MGPRSPSFPVFWSFGGFLGSKTVKNLNADLLMQDEVGCHRRSQYSASGRLPVAQVPSKRDSL